MAVSPHTPTRDRAVVVRLATVVTAALLVAAAQSNMASTPSLAALQDAAATSSQAVTSGNIALTLANGAASGQWTGAFSIVPGGASQYYRLTVTNTGSATLVYALTSTSTTNVLASTLTVAITRLASATTTCSAVSYAAGTDVGNTAPLALASTSGVVLIGNPTAGTQAGDRTLAGSANDNLCLKVDFPAGTGLGYAGRGSTAATTFTFSAESA
jgi:hypothetical protein